MNKTSKVQLTFPILIHTFVKTVLISFQVLSGFKGMRNHEFRYQNL